MLRLFIAIQLLSSIFTTNLTWLYNTRVDPSCLNQIGWSEKMLRSQKPVQKTQWTELFAATFNIQSFFVPSLYGTDIRLLRIKSVSCVIHACSHIFHSFLFYNLYIQGFASSQRYSTG